MSALDAWVGDACVGVVGVVGVRAEPVAARSLGSLGSLCNLKACLVLGLVASGLACASPDAVPGPPATPLLASTAPSEPLPIDGIWQTTNDDGLLVQVDRGRMYLQQGFSASQRHGELLYKDIHQSGPRTYRCQEPSRSGSAIVWHACALELRDGMLAAVSHDAARSDDDLDAPGTSFLPVVLADDLWFEAQIDALQIVSAREAHRPRPKVIVGPVQVPKLPPPPPPQKPVLPSQPETSPYGHYHALVVGAGDYLYLPAVATAEGDADALATLLRERYDFAVTDLRNPTLAEFTAALQRYVETLDRGDNLLLYFAGHGFLSEELGRCYWFPADATGDDPGEGIANDDIVATLREIRAGRVLVVADSCFTASELREVALDEQGPRAARPVVKTRVVLTSGGLEPIQDGAGGAHSVFTGALLEALRDNGDVLDGTALFAEIQRIVTAGASQTPEYADIRGADHEGGDFLFVPKP